jgi:hypothetical protein
MGLLTALIATPILIIGVTFSSPAILSLLGISAAGPIAGSFFAAMQGSAIASGSYLAAAQSIVMLAALPTP